MIVYSEDKSVEIVLEFWEDGRGKALSSWEAGGGRRARVKAAPLDPQSAVAQPLASWGQQGRGQKGERGDLCLTSSAFVSFQL